MQYKTTNKKKYGKQIVNHYIIYDNYKSNIWQTATHIMITTNVLQCKQLYMTI